MIHIINIKYLKSENEVTKVRPEHREFLNIGYEKGLFLASGPNEDKTGGTILAKGDINEVLALIEQDPFKLKGIAEYFHISFNPVKHSNKFKNLL